MPNVKAEILCQHWTVEKPTPRQETSRTFGLFEALERLIDQELHFSGDFLDALTDEVLMARFQGGDSDSFADLAGRYSVPLLKLAQRYVGIREDAEEVRQETLLRVFSRAGTFRSGASFRPWIYRIALNICRDRNRRRRRLQWVSLSDDTPETRSLPEQDAVQGDEAVEGRENLRRVRDLLAQLPEAQRTVVVLKEFQELTFREVAEILACPESTVKSRLYGGLSALKSLWSDQSTRPTPRPSGENRRPSGSRG